jgi:hypothetical protein
VLQIALIGFLVILTNATPSSNEAALRTGEHMSTSTYYGRGPSSSKTKFPQWKRYGWMFTFLVIVVVVIQFSQARKEGKKETDGYDLMVNDGLTVRELVDLAGRFTPKGDVESRAIDIALRLHQSQTRNTSAKRKELLCATFLKITTVSMQNLLENIGYSQSECEWVVVVYAYNASEHDPIKQQFVHDLKELTNGKHQPVVHFEDSKLRRQSMSSVRQKVDDYRAKQLGRNHNIDIGDAYKFIDDNHKLKGHNLPHNRLYMPKSILFFWLLPYLMDYNTVWIMDGDISLSSFSFPTFREILNKGFDGKDEILIAQPLIAESTQSYKYLNSVKWRESENSKVLAAKSGFIEIQAPVVDSRFFEWFILSFVLPLIIPTHVLGADWGIDQLFCRAAGMYRALYSDQLIPITELIERTHRGG